MVLAILYNLVLVIFVAMHLLVGGIISFGTGVYTGVYIAQNYEVPRVDEPMELWRKFKEFADKHRKPPGD